MTTLRDREDSAVEQTLLAPYCTPAIAEARERQDEHLIARFHGQRLRIADIGCGDGYHGSIFGPACARYHGFEIAPRLADLARARWHADGLDRAEVFLGDADDAPLAPDGYDLAWCLYFTPGNFRDPAPDLGHYDDAYLDANPKFIRVFSRFHAALAPGGAMLLCVYKDVPAAEAAQIDYYHNTGQHVVTPPGSRFVATAEQFWSARWTRASVLSNLAAFGVKPADVTFHDLGDIAWLVEVASPAA